MRFDAELALPTVTIAEIYFRDTKRKTGSACRSVGTGIARLAPSFRRSDFRFEAALAYSEIMGGAALRGRGMSAPDGMIAAIARVNGGRLAARNIDNPQAPC